jgi:pimeloyl-ACP methyl ester carboxylesterase
MYFVHCNSRSPPWRAVRHKFPRLRGEPAQHDRMRKTLFTLALMLPAAAAAQRSFQVKITGHGQPMILIPGLASSGETWDTTVDRYKNLYECHVLTLAGFAGVPRIPAPMLDKVRDDLAAYIRDKKLVKPVIVGHSLGGFLALSLVSKYPDLPGKLIIVDAYPSLAAIYQPDITSAQAKAQSAMTRQYMTSQPTSPEATRTLIHTMVSGEADFERIMSWSRASDYSAIVDAMVEMYAGDLRDDIAAIHSPTLVLGTWIGYKDYTDHAKTEANLHREYAKLEGVDIRLNDTSRHFIMYDEPQWFFAQIDGFLHPSDSHENQ